MNDIRIRLRMRGVVQGVGMRPHCVAVATRHTLSGWCYNTTNDVVIELQGPSHKVDEAINELLTTPPPLAHITSHDTTRLHLHHEEKPPFRIVPTPPATPGTPPAATPRTLIPPDVATCDDCLADMADPTNRRYRYPSPPAPTVAHD